ncbi:uncharacterized protein LOC143608486, partial [Bidens hawaiensis]|uniref:uncharacterized protein LOC143608486 n=1 Tax=Bidens hawaiensis TaxID=980011 RepID=UPI0040490031
MPLYKGCSDFTMLSALVQLFNVKSKYGVSDKCFTEFILVIKKMLPEGNEMASSTYEVKRTFKAMGSGYNKMHACINDWILYRGLYEKYEVWPTCGKSRWKKDDIKKVAYNKIPLKYYVDGFHTWVAIDDIYKFIKQDPRSLRLGIAADGVDVNRGNRHHSVWPGLAVIYNLPPWLCMKRKFIMLSLLISGTPGNDIDVFLAPLIEDLQQLFDTGVETYDAYARERFTLHVVVLWTINDYPALGTLCGCPYSGFFVCVVCGMETSCVRLRRSNNQRYGGHKRYLPYDHPFRKQRKGFDGTQECRSEPIPKNGVKIYNEMQFCINIWGKGHKNNASPMKQASNGRGGKIKKQRGTKESNTTEEGSNGKPYWKKFNIWHRKHRYWRFNSVNHCTDFMHIEKNVAESLIGALLNIPGKTKDGLEARLDLNDMDLKPELTPKSDGANIRLPPASYTLKTKEKDKFCDTLYKLRVPQGYCSNFASLVSLKDRKLIGLKSHDYHMLMQQFVPLAVRSIMPQPTRYAIIRFCVFFKSICSKEIEVEEVDKLEAYLFVTLCLLEKYFHPSFFDVMVHLTVLISREIKLCGLNVAEETIEFLCELKKDLKTIGIPNSLRKSIENKNRASNKDGVPLSTGKPLDDISLDLFVKAHFYVLQNTFEIVPYIDRHMSFLERQNPDKKTVWLEKEHNLKFGMWLRYE